MTQTELTCSDCGIARAESAAETKRSERRHPWLGLLIVLTTAIIFYGGIAVLIRKFL